MNKGDESKVKEILLEALQASDSLKRELQLLTAQNDYMTKLLNELEEAVFKDR